MSYIDIQPKQEASQKSFNFFLPKIWGLLKSLDLDIWGHGWFVGSMPILERWCLLRCYRTTIETMWTQTQNTWDLHMIIVVLSLLGFEMGNYLKGWHLFVHGKFSSCTWSSSTSRLLFCPFPSLCIIFAPLLVSVTFEVHSWPLIVEHDLCVLCVTWYLQFPPVSLCMAIQICMLGS